MSKKQKQPEDIERTSAEWFAESQKRGKVTVGAKASWGAKTGDGQELDTNAARELLREALGN